MLEKKVEYFNALRFGKFGGLEKSTEGRVFALRQPRLGVANPGLVSGIPYSPVSQTRSNLCA